MTSSLIDRKQQGQIAHRGIAIDKKKQKTEKLANRTKKHTTKLKNNRKKGCNITQ